MSDTAYDHSDSKKGVWFLKCNSCDTSWPDGAAISVANADCCHKPNIHVWNHLEGPALPYDNFNGTGL